jgi:hypothetical protein
VFDFFLIRHNRNLRKPFYQARFVVLRVVWQWDLNHRVHGTMNFFYLTYCTKILAVTPRTQIIQYSRSYNNGQRGHRLMVAQNQILKIPRNRCVVIRAT